MFQVEEFVKEFAENNGLDIAIAYTMPQGREDWYCNYDVESKTLFLNTSRIGRARDFEATYYVLHDLRHAVQFHIPQLFNKDIQKSVRYAIFYNGTCFKFEGEGHKECVLDGDEEYFISVSESMPYELECHQYACRETIQKYPNKKREIESLRNTWLPFKMMSMGELERVLAQIDERVK